jgi:TRAP-type C4-dicarboxylate transport system substrate-binding protein
MKRKALFVLLVLALAAITLIGACSQQSTTTSPPPAAPSTSASAPAGPQTISLKFASIWPDTHYTHTTQLPRAFKMVEDAAGGKYKLDIQMFPVGTLLSGDQLYDGVVTDVADAGVSSFGYTPGRFPVMLTMNQPGLAPPTSADSAAAAMWEFYNKYQPKELQDVHVFYLFATGPGWMHSNKPIRTVDDMKGLKIRVTGAGVDGVTAVGGDPVAIPMGDVYEAAQKGTIDALVSPPETLEGWKHAEIFKYSTFVPQFYSEFFWVAINLDKWNSLPADLQAAFTSVAPAAVKDAGAIWQYQQQHGMDFAKNSPGGHEFIQLPDTEVTKLENLLAPIRDKYVADLNSKGLPGEEIANTAASLVKKYNQMTYAPYQP